VADGAVADDLPFPFTCVQVAAGMQRVAEYKAGPVHSLATLATFCLEPRLAMRNCHHLVVFAFCVQTVQTEETSSND
jgi:hypothetical protein